MFDTGFYKNKRVFITGHTGFKGSWMCEVLFELGADVYGYSLEPPTNPSLFELSDMSNKINSTAVDIENTQRKVSDTYTFANGLKYSLVSYSGYGTQANVSAVLQGKKQKLKEWYANHRGTYLNEDGDYVFGTDDNHSFYVPAYQFPVIWSICGMMRN